MIGARAFMAVGCAAALAAACTANTPAKTTTKTVVVHPSPSSTAPSSPAAPPTQPPASAPIRTTAMSKLPGHCAGLLAASRIDSAVGHAVRGRTAFVVGQPDKSIGRVGYINCRYGVPSGNGTPKVEIQVSLYRTSKQAGARIKPTTNDYDAHGAKAAAVTIDGLPGTLLTGGSGAGYGPTVVLAVGQRTIAVTLAPDAVPAARVQHDLVALTSLAARRTSA